MRKFAVMFMFVFILEGAGQLLSGAIDTVTLKHGTTASGVVNMAEGTDPSGMLATG